MLWQIKKEGKRFHWLLGTVLSLGLVVNIVGVLGPGTAAGSTVREPYPSNTSPAGSQALAEAAIIKDCNDYYLQGDFVNVGSDGLQPLADRTAPIADTAKVASATLNTNAEIAHFYSHPALTNTWQLSGDITGVLWVNTSRSTTTTLKIQVFDYNPVNGAKASLGDFPLTLLSAGETSVEFNITPPAVTVAAGHRLLFVLQGIKGSPPSKVDLFYDSRTRASRFSICRSIQGGPSISTVYLPVIIANKAGPQTVLRVDSVNTGGINPVRILNPSTNQELLRCSVGNNVLQTCGSFSTPANSSYKITASTKNCGFLQGTFSDASPGGTVTRRIYCN